MPTRVLRTVPLDTIDRRSRVGVALRRVREDLRGQLGEVSPAESMLVDHAAKLHVIATAVSEYLFAQETLARDGELLPVVVQYGALVANLTRLLTTLGLRPRKKSVEPFQEFLARVGRTSD